MAKTCKCGEVHTMPRRVARYTDGTLVQEGDRIRYIQAPGGLMAPVGWRTGTAQKYPYYPDYSEFDRDELFLFDGEHYYGISGHVTESVS